LYESGKDPWDYSDDVLETYCKRCHSLVEYFKKEFKPLSLIRTIYKEENNGEYFTVYTICMEKSKVLLAVFNYYGENNIELVVHIPSAVVKIVSSLLTLQNNG